MADSKKIPDEKGTEDAGLTCRECGCRHFRVIYTRKASGDRIVRRRECRHCGRRITTVEKERPNEQAD